MYAGDFKCPVNPKHPKNAGICRLKKKNTKKRKILDTCQTLYVLSPIPELDLPPTQFRVTQYESSFQLSQQAALIEIKCAHIGDVLNFNLSLT
jgi:hypothetical protein